MEIRSHGVNDHHYLRTATETSKVNAEESKERNAPSVIREEVKGFALTVKESYTDNILKICRNVRPATFLNSSTTDEERPLFCAGTSDQLVIVSDESALISSIDQKQIISWLDFEYVLCLVLENRILKLYQAHLANVYSQIDFDSAIDEEDLQ